LLIILEIKEYHNKKVPEDNSLGTFNLLHYTLFIL